MQINKLVLGDCARIMVGAIHLLLEKVIKIMLVVEVRLLLLFIIPLDYKTVADVYRAKQSLLEGWLLIGIQLESGTKS